MTEAYDPYVGSAATAVGAEAIVLAARLSFTMGQPFGIPALALDQAIAPELVRTLVVAIVAIAEAHEIPDSELHSVFTSLAAQEGETP